MATTDEGILLTARVHLISSTTVLGAIYGSTFGLYILCARHLYLQLKDPDRRRQNLITILYMSLVMTCGLLEIAVHALEIQASYVDHADYPGGGFAYAMEVFSALPISAMGYSMSLLLDSLTFGVQIWRLWVIWQTSRYSLPITILPILTLLAYIAFKIAHTVVIYQQSTEGGTHVQNLIMHASGALQLFTTVFVTLLIIAKLVVCGKHTKSIGHSETSSQCASIIIMLVESYVLQSLWIAVTTSLQFSPNPAVAPATMFFLNTQPFIQILSYLLVVYRITTGWGSEKATEDKPGTLQWNRNEPRTAHTSTRGSIPVFHEEI